MKLNARLATALGAAVLLGLGLCWALIPSAAGGSDARIVKVGLYDNAPKVYLDRHGRPAGLFVELLRAIARKQDWSLQFVSCHWAGCLKRLRQGRIDLMPDVAYSAKRGKRLDFHTVPVAYSWSQVYRSPATSIHSVGDLSDHRVAVLRNSIQSRYMAELKTGSGLAFKQVPVDSYTQGFEAVRDGRADAVVCNNFVGARNAGRFGLVETPIMFQPVSLYFATTKGRNGDLLKGIDHYLARWRDDPDSVYFAALRRAMVPAPVTVVPAWLELVVAGAGGGLALLLGFSVALRWRVRRATAALDHTNRQLDQVLSASPVVLYVLRRRGGELSPEWVSPNIQRLFGFTPEQALEPDWWRRRVHPDDRDAGVALLDSLFRRGHLSHEYRIIDAQGRVRYIRDELRLTGEHERGGERIVGTWSDLTHTREQEARLDFLLNHDALTGLPNRTLLRQRLVQAVGRQTGEPRSLAVLCIDLDRFKNINDTLGHSLGDEILRGASRRIQAAVGDNDLLASIGGDQFIVVADGHAHARDAAQLATEILNAFAEPLVAGDQRLVITASIGVSRYPGDGRDADTLLKHAELALYEAKARGRNTHCFFAPELSADLGQRLAIENELRGAADRGELVLHYQPQFDLASGDMVGVEALVRWNHPRRGLVAPNQFIPLAEETGLINEIALWVMHNACAQVVRWEQDGLAVPRVAVNLSVRQIERGVLSGQVAEVLAKTQLEASRLELEITESTIMHEPEKAIGALGELKTLGVMLSVDDFGTGHSSLSYLKRLPLDRLKIDKSFVGDIGHDANDEAISRAVIGLARSLGLESVAEGVEREEQAEFLRAEGCEFAQGYLFGHPVPADALYETWGGFPSRQRPLREEGGGA